MPKIMLIAGRTGGPILPLLAIYKNLAVANLEAIVIGIRGGYEESLCQKEGLALEYLPEAKLRPKPSTNNPLRLLIYFLDIFGTILILFYSICRSLLLFFKHQPGVVISAGSFLAVPIVYAAKLANWFFFQKIKVVVHQQDPLPGLANRLTVGMSDLKTCVFEYTQSNYAQFREADIIPNPINLENLQNENIMQTALDIAEDKPFLHNFFRGLSEDKPLLLIFGGASGAEQINDWVIENVNMLKSRFNILHLTGSLQNKHYQLAEASGYLSTESLTEKEMKLALNVSDVVLCRAGLASISELLYLHKPAYLVPIPDSHQELNAELVSDYFCILDQREQSKWLSTLFTSYPQFFHNIEYPKSAKIETKLKDYYQKVASLL